MSKLVSFKNKEYKFIVEENKAKNYIPDITS